ncbi:MAG: hypothetical protein US16_C0048G0011 [Candidatus Moranbacteria bacterium GW2011_GWE2_36_40]|nr:MAG: hypothetical protein US16_C0048G0011 [Candidatus Moranbacteria bacterium GW2011_GWE2_36_40]
MFLISTSEEKLWQQNFTLVVFHIQLRKMHCVIFLLKQEALPPEAQAAIEMFDKKDYEGRSLTVNEARPMEARPPRRDFDGGGNRGGYGSRNNY